jgi:hypothetical protein
MWRGWLAGVVLALVVVGCGGRDLAPYQAAIDELGLPPTWHIAQTTTKSQGGQSGCVELINGTCPSVTRYYVVVGALADVLQTANIAVAAEGFGGIEVTHPACDVVSSGPPCYLTGTKGELAIDVNVYRPGDDVDQLGLSRPDAAIVRIIVHRH